MSRRVRQDVQKITVITDLQIVDHTSLGALQQIIYSPDTSLKQWRHMVRDGTVKAKTSIVVLMVGNSQMPFPAGLSPNAQLKKLVLKVWQMWTWVRKVVVCGVLPRADRETEFENEVRVVNVAYAKAVRELRKHFVVAANTILLATHKLFLEKFEYFDFQTGHTAYQIRIVKPLDRYFVPGTKKLNKVGLFHLHSYVLQHLGLVQEMNDWNGIPTRSEPGDVQRAKRKAHMPVTRECSFSRNCFSSYFATVCSTPFSFKRCSRPLIKNSN